MYLYNVLLNNNNVYIMVCMSVCRKREREITEDPDVMSHTVV